MTIGSLDPAEAVKELQALGWVWKAWRMGAEEWVLGVQHHYGTQVLDALSAAKVPVEDIPLLMLQPDLPELPLRDRIWAERLRRGY